MQEKCSFTFDLRLLTLQDSACKPVLIREPNSQIDRIPSLVERIRRHRKMVDQKIEVDGSEKSSSL